MKIPTRRPTWPLFVPALLLAVLPLPADDGVKPSACVWKGTITLRRQGQGTPVKPKPEKDKTVTVSGSHDLSETITIEVCGEPGEMYIRSVTRTLADDAVTVQTEQCHFADCLDERARHKRVAPGHHGEARNEVHTRILQSLDTPKLRDRTHVRLEFSGDVWVRISGSQTALLDSRWDFTRTDHSACDGSETRVVIHNRTGAPGSKRQSDRQGSKEGKNSTEIITHTNPPELSTRSFSFAFPCTGLQLKGSRELDRVSAPNWEMTETAEWDLQGVPACSDILDQLREDIAFAEAYSLKEIAGFAGSIREYESLVSDRAWRIRHGRHVPRGEESSELDAGTDSQGKQVGLEELEQRLREQCRHGMIFQSIAAHEDVHTRQQERFPEYDDGTPLTHGLMEVSAYVADARMLLEWLKENCPGTPLGDEERRLQELEATAARYMPE